MNLENGLAVTVQKRRRVDGPTEDGPSQKDTHEDCTMSETQELEQNQKNEIMASTALQAHLGL